MEVLGFDVPIYVLLIVVAVILLYIHTSWKHDFFRQQGIPGPKPYPFYGNTLGRGMMHAFQNWKQIYGNVFGVFVGREPVFVICDVDILKEVLVKSFNNFRNRRKSGMVSHPFSLGVFFLEDSAWKRVRNIITPTFSGGKLRAILTCLMITWRNKSRFLKIYSTLYNHVQFGEQNSGTFLMCPAINDCAQTLAKNFCQEMKRGKPVNMKEYFGAFTMDVISNTAFSVKVDSQNDLNNPFVTHAKKIFNPNPARRPLFLLIGLFPFLLPLFRAFGFSFFPKYVSDFFVKNIKDMIKERQMESKEEREKRADFLQLLMDAEIQDDDVDKQVANGASSNGHIPDKQSVRRLTTDEIVGQGMIFFIAGYETTASTLNFASYSLATHPDVQEKLYQEIKDVLGDDEPDYENIQKLKYMENVINETLRLFPPIVFIHRQAAETITIGELTIPKGYSVFIPTFSINRDPQSFPDPEEFKPERFDDKVNPFSFLSFGYGPRICIGMRLALVEAKIALVHVMRKVKFEAGPETPAKMSFKSITVLQPTQPNLLKLTPRC